MLWFAALVLSICFISALSTHYAYYSRVIMERDCPADRRARIAPPEQIIALPAIKRGDSEYEWLFELGF